MDVLNLIELHDGPMGELLPTPEEMARMDDSTIQGGVPAEELMVRAGNSIHRELVEILTQAGVSEPLITILCGPGNNGGDGLVVARRLYEEGRAPRVLIAGASRYTKEFINRAAELSTVGGELLVYSVESDEEALPFRAKPVSAEEVEALFRESSIYLDALLGTGQRSAPKGAIAELLVMLEKYREDKFVLAVDIPTGVNAASGEVFSPTLAADVTVSIQLVKRGLVQYPAREQCGRIVCRPIGIDCSSGSRYSMLLDSTVPRLPIRAPDAHKGSFGHVLVIGGSRNMPGAPVLSANAALRAGAGLVTAVLPFDRVRIAAIPEIMYQLCGSATDGCFRKGMLPEIKPLLEQCSCVALGPGLGHEEQTREFVFELIREASALGCPMVIDADALNFIGGEKVEVGGGGGSNCVLTPHPGEASCLLSCSSEEIQRDRYSAAEKIAARFGGVCVLKGAGSVIAGQESGRVSAAANAALATAGSGDVLTGVIAALLARGAAPFDAASLGVHIHAQAGMQAAEQSGGLIIASDMISRIPALISQFTDK